LIGQPPQPLGLHQLGHPLQLGETPRGPVFGRPGGIIREDFQGFRDPPLRLGCVEHAFDIKGPRRACQ